MKKVRQLYKGANGSVLLTIPKQILDILKAKAGDSILFIAENNKIELKKLDV